MAVVYLAQMELEILASLGPIHRAIYVLYGSSANPESLASALASLLPQPARIFSIESDLLMPAEGRSLVEALTHSSTVLIIGSPESRFIQSLGHYWPDYCKHPSSSHPIFRHVVLGPTRDSSKLACIYLLIPTLPALTIPTGPECSGLPTLISIGCSRSLPICCLAPSLSGAVGRK